MEITGIITAIVFGAAIGGLGRLVAPGRNQLSMLVTILVGIVAAVAGTGVAELIGVADTDGIDWTEIALQVVFAGGGGHAPLRRAQPPGAAPVTRYARSQAFPVFRP